MTIRTRSKLQAQYDRTAQQFAQRAVDRAGSRVHSIVLYGSVARKNAGKESDVDVLVLSDEGEALRGALADISGDIEFETGYKAVIETVLLTPQAFSEILQSKDPFGEQVLGEGIVLHDDGTFERFCEGAVAGWLTRC